MPKITFVAYDQFSQKNLSGSFLENYTNDKLPDMKSHKISSTVPKTFLVDPKTNKIWLPPYHHGDKGLPGTNIKLEKDRFIQVPVWSLQNDELYWKEPSKFNPDRFLPENKGDIVQGTYLPFGLGPRNCIAQRFALMEVKVAVARLIQEFHLSLAPGREELGINKGPMMRPFDTMPLLLTPVSHSEE